MTAERQKREEVQMSEIKKTEVVDEDEYMAMLNDVCIYDDDEIDEQDIEDERLFECRKKK